MHYYQFNIGDYKSHTDHLDPIEDIAYRRMIDHCYLHEIALPLDVKEISRLIRMRTHCEVIEVVLSEFFVKKNDGYICKRVIKDIKAFKEKSNKAKKSAEARWNKPSKDNNLDGNPKQCETDANALPSDSESNANHKPLTINHKPLNNIKDPIVQPEAKPSKCKFEKCDLDFVDGMINLLTGTNPNFKIPNKESWANTIRLMRERDNLDLTLMANVFKWANNDSFWSSNIQSPDKLRKQWNTLSSKFNGQNKSSSVFTPSNQKYVGGKL